MDNQFLREIAHTMDKETLKRVCSIYKILVSAGITFEEGVHELERVKTALKYAEIKKPSE